MSISIIDLPANYIEEQQITLLKILIDATNCPLKIAEYQKQIDEIEKKIIKTLYYDA